MVISIRKASIDDISRLNQLIPESVRRLSVDFYSSEQIEGAISDVFGIDTRLVLDQTYFAACVGDALVGCGGWSKRRTLFGGDQMKKGDDDLLDPATEAARIRAFFIDPNWARRGIGGRIMRTCEDAARDAGFKELELVATLPGEPLYRAYGFLEVARYEVPLSNGASLPVVSMIKTIAADS